MNIILSLSQFLCLSDPFYFFMLLYVKHYVTFISWLFSAFLQWFMLNFVGIYVFSLVYLVIYSSFLRIFLFFPEYYQHLLFLPAFCIVVVHSWFL